MNWKAEYCEKIYGVQYNRDEEFFICPECGEPIYNDDWDNPDWDWRICPICGFDFVEGVNE